MNIPNKRKLQQIVHNLLSDICFKDFMNLSKKGIAKPHSFLVIDDTLASDNPSGFRKNLLERIQKLIMTIDDNIRDEKLQYGINREAAKHQLDQLEKLKNMNILQVKKYYLLIKEV